jgi:hypothetical protein
VFSAYSLGPLVVTPPTAPHVSGIGARSGRATGGQQLTIVGSNFDPGSIVTFGGVASPHVQIDASGTRIIATTPPHAPGAVSVNVNGDNGRSPTWTTTFIRYIGAPLPTGVTPNRGTFQGGTHVVITGSRLNDATVMIGNKRLRVLSESSNRLIVAAPSGHRGAHAALTLSTAGGSARAATFTWT